MTNKEAIEILLKTPIHGEGISSKEIEKIKEAFYMAIDSLKRFSWIPVSERLPERYKEVIVTDIETSDTYQSQYLGNGYWECDNGTLKNRIIAWMPLPEKYKKGAKE